MIGIQRDTCKNKLNGILDKKTMDECPGIHRVHKGV